MRKEKIKEIAIDVLIILFIAIVCCSNIFTNSIGNLDELWNYNFARNISDGLIPYRDFNIVQMPLLAMICAIFLNLFGNQLLVMRIVAVIMMTSIFFIAYKILKFITKKEIAQLILVVSLFLYKDILCIDYNYAVLLISLILLYLELKHLERKPILEYDPKYNFMIGFIAGLAVLCKQTTGLAISMACIGYTIFAIRKKENIKSFLKIACTRVLGVLIPLVIFAIYIYINNASKDFIDYTILGLNTFSNKISYKNLFNNEILGVMAIIVPFAIIVMFTRIVMKNNNQKILVLFAYAVSSFIVTFPICDKIHFLTGSLITIIAIVYMIYELLILNRKIKKNIKLLLYGIFSFITIFLILLLTFKSMEKIKKDYIQVDKEQELIHFIGIPENVGLKYRIKEIDEYVIEKQKEGKKVYILDAEAAIYMIPLDIYNKNYDMFLKGNLGSKGENGIIERIEKEENAIYLIKQDYLNWQNPNQVREYIINNLNYIQEKSIFYVYEK